MVIRSIIYLAIGLGLVVLACIANAKLGWSVDIAWLLVAAAAFAHPAELAPIAGLTFGLVLDGLSGSMGVYTISYAGLGAVLMATRKVFYLEGLVPGWLLALVGAEALWLFFGAFARAINVLGGATRTPGFFSPFLLSVLIGYPVVHAVTRWVLPRPKEVRRIAHYGTTTRIIDKT